MAVVRDWLLGHGGIETIYAVDLTGSEDAALAAHFGVALDPAGQLADRPGGQAARLSAPSSRRRYSFTPAGIAPSGVGSEAPTCGRATAPAVH